jgi:hypothetical protein
MSSQWRGGPNVKGTLGTLLRTTMHQVGVVKDAAVRQARTQRVWLDSAMLTRKRRELLAQLGEQLVERVRSGEEAELAMRWPELAASVEELDQLEADLDEATARSREAVPAVSAAWARAKAGRGEPPARRPEDLRVWRPVLDDDDPPAEVADAPSPAAAAVPAADPADRGRRRRARFSAGGPGGISFGADIGDDDDLEQYMHDDDVPEPTR